MLSSQRILFPVDYSDYAFAVSPAVAELVNRPNVEVTLLHVVDGVTPQASGLARRMEMLDVLARRHFSGCTVRRRLDHGSPEMRILDYIRENRIGMVVTSARDSGGFGKGPLGSVATRILREASCPVWLDWRTESRQAPMPAITSRICCALDGARSAERFLNQAAVIADRLRGDLTIIAAVQPGQFTDPSRSAREVRRETERIDKLRRRCAPRAELSVAVGWREAVIGRTIREQRASLLITGDCRQSVVAAEPTCPVLRLIDPLPETLGLRSAPDVEYRRVA